MEDYIYKIKNTYAQLPLRIRTALGYLYGKVPLKIRYGKNYFDMYRRLIKEEYYSNSQILEIQMEALRDLVKYCSEKVPFYSMLFSEYGINANQIHTIEEYQKIIPHIQKSDVQNNLELFIPRNIKRSKILNSNTGGSTGIPLQLFYEKNVTRSLEYAFIHNLWKRVGYKHGDPTVVLRGFSIPQSKNYWYYDATKNRLIMSSYHINKNTIPEYIKEIRTFKPKYLHVYPSSLNIIAKYMQEYSIAPLSNIEAILAGSETIYPEQRKLLEGTFNCRLFSWYGLGEMVALGGECEYSTDYHFYPQYGLVELEKDKTIGSYEIVGTTFVNPAMPLLRYKTGDFVELSDNETCRCRRNYLRIKRVIGRKQELIVSKSHSLITLTALIFGLHHNAFKNIRRMQIEQNTPGKITVRIDKMDSFTKTDEEEIKTNMNFATKGDLEFDFVYSSNIQLTEMGKHKFLIQQLNIIDYI
jgi:phenylacetate-CoA ligase